MAAPLGLVASGMLDERARNRQLGQTDRQIGLQERQLGLTEQQMQAESQAKQRAAVAKNVGDLLSLADQTAQAVIQRAEDQGLDREAIIGQAEQQIAPLIQRAAVLAQASGDPTLAMQVQGAATRLQAYRSRADVVNEEAGKAGAIAAAQESARVPGSAQGAAERYYALAERARAEGDDNEAARFEGLARDAQRRDLARQNAGRTTVSVAPATYGIGPSGERVLLGGGSAAPGAPAPRGGSSATAGAPAGGVDPKFFTAGQQATQARLAAIEESQRNLSQVQRLVTVRPDLFGASGKLRRMEQNFTGSAASLFEGAKSIGGEVGQTISDLMSSVGITDPEMASAQFDATLQQSMSFEDYQEARKTLGLEGNVGTVQVLENMLVFNVARALQQEGDRLLAASINQAKELVNLTGLLEAPETVSQKTNALYTQLESLRESVQRTLQTNVGLQPPPREAPRLTPGTPKRPVDPASLSGAVRNIKTPEQAKAYMSGLGKTREEIAAAARNLSREEKLYLLNLIEQGKSNGD